MNEITSRLTLDDLLIQAAEEASELAQALTKYYRVIHASNPTPVSLAEAREAIVEEIADVNVAAEALRLKLMISCDDIAEVEAKKIERWRRRANDGV